MPIPQDKGRNHCKDQNRKEAVATPREDHRGDLQCKTGQGQHADENPRNGNRRDDRHDIAHRYHTDVDQVVKGDAGFFAPRCQQQGGRDAKDSRFCGSKAIDQKADEGDERQQHIALLEKDGPDRGDVLRVRPFKIEFACFKAHGNEQGEHIEKSRDRCGRGDGGVGDLGHFRHEKGGSAHHRRH